MMQMLCRCASSKTQQFLLLSTFTVELKPRPRIFLFIFYMSVATIINSKILPPHVPIILNNRVISRSISSVPPDSGTIGGIVAVIAEKLGIGE